MVGSCSVSCKIESTRPGKSARVKSRARGRLIRAATASVSDAILQTIEEC
jgi:hypothetical protein